MWIEVIKPYVPHLGYKGVQRDIPANEAHVHVLLGNAVQIETPESAAELSVISRESRQAAPIVRKKRAYRRRDLRAEE